MNRIHIVIGLSLGLLCARAFPGVYNSNHTALIETGDSAYTVQQELGDPVDSNKLGTGRYGQGSEEYNTYNINGQDHTLHMIDGKVYTIDGDENIN